MTQHSTPGYSISLDFRPEVEMVVELQRLMPAGGNRPAELDHTVGHLVRLIGTKALLQCHILDKQLSSEETRSLLQVIKGDKP